MASLRAKLSTFNTLFMECADAQRENCFATTIVCLDFELQSGLYYEPIISQHGSNVQEAVTHKLQ